MPLLCACAYGTVLERARDELNRVILVRVVETLCAVCMERARVCALERS